MTNSEKAAREAVLDALTQRWGSTMPWGSKRVIKPISEEAKKAFREGRGRRIV